MDNKDITFLDVKIGLLKYITEEEADRIILMMLCMIKHNNIRNKLNKNNNFIIK